MTSLELLEKLDELDILGFERYKNPNEVYVETNGFEGGYATLIFNEKGECIKIESEYDGAKLFKQDAKEIEELLTIKERYKRAKERGDIKNGW